MFTFVNPYRLLLFGGIFILVVVSSFASGYHLRSIRAESQINALRVTAAQEREDALLAAVAVERKLQEYVDVIGKLNETAAQEETEHQRVVTREVIKYVQNPDSRQCGLDATGVRIHNLAAAGGMPKNTSTTSRSDGSTTRDVTGAELIPVIQENYHICREQIRRIKGLQSYVNQLLAAQAAQ